MRCGGARPPADSAGPPRHARLTVAPAAVVAAHVLRCRFGAARTGSGGGANVEIAAGKPAAPGNAQPSGFVPAPFQAEGADRLSAALRRWGGAVLADDTGLGKTYTALEVVRRVLVAGDAVIIIVPTVVRPHWLSGLQAMCQRFGRGHRAAAGRVRLVTHGQLSRARSSHGVLDRELAPARGAVRLVVVDEAHAFRNPNTRRYRSLALLCRASRVLLVTATPVNNSLWDLYFLIRLWSGDGAYRALGVPDLRALFARVADRATVPRGPPPAALRRLLGALLVRRSRSAVDAALPGRRPGVGGAAFPARRAPAVVVYSLRHAYGPRLPAALDAIAALRLPWFETSAHAGVRADRGAAALVRLMLLKRLESSVAALRLSLERLSGYNRMALDALAAGTLLLPGAARPRGAPADADQLLLPLLVGTPLPAWLDPAAVGRAARADDAALTDLLGLLGARAAPSGVRPDPKLDALVRVLASVGSPPAIVFTAFRDTAEYLATRLGRRHRVAVLHGSGGAVGGHAAPRGEVVCRFAPRANGCRVPGLAERIDVLVATDALSEGLNLQDAGCVISYDLPWNPVRLVQRVGRIDRLGSPHRLIETHHFLPDAELDALLGLAERLGAKLDAIRIVAGRAAARAAEFGATTPAGRRQQPIRSEPPRSRSALDAQRALAGTAARSPAGLLDGVAAGEEALWALWRDRGDASGPPRAPDRRRALHACLSRRAGDPSKVAIFGRGTEQIAVAAASPGARLLDAAELAALLERAFCEVRSRRPEPVDAEWLARARRLATRISGGSVSAGVTAARPGRAEPAVARQLHAALAAEPGGPPPRTAARADALLARLRSGVSTGEAIALRRLLRDKSLRSADEFIDAVLAALDPERTAGRRAIRRRPPPLVAVFELVDPP